ncbi:hypothetical protein GUITHDRAFT_131593 [Guillardia theta CCMP2712]|uniref:Uncharacterized protein n=1 Tax=Guillardia theta (strain CCMP2712) TaxID=905079 RepID=L1K4V5_GUITC|nr:hypothetical protein GUITHDRAFT_131593 [Guillardia theta CCMP2712]EKX55378.1 hypothetical protein GUITHDRAFT_131593 [Guillardia theta CCMP2712]|eukprot:XP_005842358.1 hypothetical protein GUITHDRAFT_131593 [Guillardia theta CCMP2712]
MGSSLAPFLLLSCFLLSLPQTTSTSLTETCALQDHCSDGDNPTARAGSDKDESLGKGQSAMERDKIEEIHVSDSFNNIWNYSFLIEKHDEGNETKEESSSSMSKESDEKQLPQGTCRNKQQTPTSTESMLVKIEIQPITILSVGTTLTVYGLVGSQTADTERMEVESEPAGLVREGRGRWLQAPGTLAIELAIEVKAGEAAAIRFRLRNPLQPQDAPPAGIRGELGGGGGELREQRLGGPDGGRGWRGALQVRRRPGFTTRRIGQSCPLTSSHNTLWVTLESNAELAGGTELTISGLAGAQVEDGAITVECSEPVLGSRREEAETSSWMRWLSGGTEAKGRGGYEAGRGRWRNGSLSLTVLPDRALAEGRAYVLAINVTNPPSPQAAPTIGIEARGEVSIGWTAMEAGGAGESRLGVAGGGRALEVRQGGLVAVRAGQTNPFVGGRNTVWVSATSNCSLRPGSSVAVRGLGGRPGGRGREPGARAWKRRPGEEGGREEVGWAWGAEREGEVNLTLATEVEAGEELVIELDMTNAEEQDGATVEVEGVVYTGQGWSGLAGARAESEEGSVLGVERGGAPLVIRQARLQRATARQSDPTAGEENEIRIMLQAKYTVVAGSTLTVYGLVGSQTADTERMEVESEPAGLVREGRGRWLQAPGTLAIELATEVKAGEAAAIRFRLRNPLQPQDAPPAGIRGELGGGGGELREQRLGGPDGGRGWRGALQVRRRPGFTTRRIGQSCPLAGALNNISVTLVASTELEGDMGAAITVSGLVGAQADRRLRVWTVDGKGGDWVPSRRSCRQGEAGWGEWEETGRLRMAVCAGERIAGGEEYVVRFTVRNPPTAQEAVRAEVRAGLEDGEGEVLYEGEAMEAGSGPAMGVAGGARPMMVREPALTRATIEQSTRVASAENELTVRLEGNFALPAGAEVIIAGLRGSGTGDREGMAVRSEPGGTLGETGRWDQESGTLRVRARASSEGPLRLAVTFQIVQEQLAVTPIDSSPINKDASDYVFSVIQPRLNVTAMYLCRKGSNRMSLVFELRSNIDLTSGTSIRLGGLEGIASSKALRLSPFPQGANGELLFACLWSLSPDGKLVGRQSKAQTKCAQLINESLILDIGEGSLVQASTTYKFSVTFSSPSCPPSKTLNIQVTGKLKIPRFRTRLRELSGQAEEDGPANPILLHILHVLVIVAGFAIACWLQYNEKLFLETIKQLKLKLKSR